MTLKLFVADDSITIHKVIELAFEDTDTIIKSVTHGEEVPGSIRTFEPNIVLLDVNMPGISGYELCSLLKNNQNFSHIPVVLLVGTLEKFDESEAVRAGYDARLTKPFDPLELVNVVKQLVKGTDNRMPEIETESDQVLDEKEDQPDISRLEKKMSKKRIAVRGESRESFLGDNRVLDLFESESITKANNLSTPATETSDSNEGVKTEQVSKEPITMGQMSDELIDAIVERVVKRMSEEVISEIAWEIVPELSEIIIRRSIEENGKV